MRGSTLRECRARGSKVVRLALVLVFSPSLSGADSETKLEAWGNTDLPGIHRFTAHGSVVWGHQFGFVKRPGSCDTEIIWMSWSSVVPVDDLVGIEATVKLEVGDTVVPIPVDLLTQAPLTATGRMKVMVFSNFVAGPMLIALLAAGEQVQVTFEGPGELLDRLDVRSDRFTLNGYSESRGIAEETCNGPLALGVGVTNSSR